jgi:hypothetical protein
MPVFGFQCQSLIINRFVVRQVILVKAGLAVSLEQCPWQCSVQDQNAGSVA